MSTLSSGQTLVGKYYLLESAEEVGDLASDTISYQFPLASTPVTNYRPPDTAPTANCPGTEDNPQAAPGNLCVYSEERDVDATYSGDGFDHDRVDRFGAGLAVRSSTAVGPFFDVGTWAVTAP